MRTRICERRASKMLPILPKAQETAENSFRRSFRILPVWKDRRKNEACCLNRGGRGARHLQARSGPSRARSPAPSHAREAGRLSFQPEGFWRYPDTPDTLEKFAVPSESGGNPWVERIANSANNGGKPGPKGGFAVLCVTTPPSGHPGRSCGFRSSVRRTCHGLSRREAR